MNDKIINRYFFVLLSVLPISFLIGPSISLLNILIFDISFLILLISKKNFDVFKNSIVKILLILYLYLIFNTFISIDPSISFNRNFGFLRLIIFFIGINYFFQKEEFVKIFNVWLIVIFIIVFDIFFEKYFGNNILGYGKDNERVVSFFKDEAIPGGFVYAFSFIIIGYFMNAFKKNSNLKNIFLLFVVFLLLISVITTGERSNSIKFILSLLFFCFFIGNISLKKKLLLIISFITVITIFLMNNDFLKGRMYYSIKYSASTFISSFMHGVPRDNPSGNIYAKLYRSGFDVFKKYPIFGAGNKNYRVETCNSVYQLNVHKLTNDYYCMTHPHQIYFEFLSEHGIIGTIILLYVFFLIFFQMLKIILLEKNYISLGCLAYLLFYFTPILPSGAFFSDYNISLFFINLSIGYAVSKGLNIFKL